MFRAAPALCPRGPALCARGLDSRPRRLGLAPARPRLVLAWRYALINSGSRKSAFQPSRDAPTSRNPS
ncbi:hypothetical protein MILUP08_40760 [Micromonospora lupini str. Lupac 08]|uniref:Uncharacterized protein n=1 Tax=Micromonospora lupini str. Lupac 08 TaxID=1150864 RepID=I0KWA2_9ACTN|nr:hypothetical protein MILUP08_40760 [Micromonospora lupini str. Lupac 08]